MSFTSDGVIGLDPQSGKLLWRTAVKTSSAGTSPRPWLCGDMVVVSSHEAGLLGFRISPAGSGMKAEQAWVRKDLAINFSSPVLVGQYLYGLGPKKKLFCLDITDGQGYLGEDQRGGQSGGVRFALGDEGQSVRAGRQRQAYLVAADPKECRVVSSTKVCGRNWCNPAYVDGKLLDAGPREPAVPGIGEVRKS